MTPRIHLVSGSRVLRTNSAAMQAVRSILERTIEALPPGSTVVFGDAPGPDRWAWSQVLQSNLTADAERLRWAGFCLDGRIAGTSRLFGNQWLDVHDLHGHAQHAKLNVQRATHGDRWPLHRNAQMVLAIASARQRLDIDLSMHAFVATWSATHGTEHTVAQWRQRELHGLVVSGINEHGEVVT